VTGKLVIEAPCADAAVAFGSAGEVSRISELALSQGKGAFDGHLCLSVIASRASVPSDATGNEEEPPMSAPGTDASELVSRLRRDLSAVQLDCDCRTRLHSALDRFSVFEERRRLRTGLQHARRQRDWIAAQLAFLAELDEITDHETDRTVFEEMALLFDEIGIAAGEAALAIREGTAPAAADGDGSPAQPRFD
jgi:hypothetical protein